MKPRTHFNTFLLIAIFSMCAICSAQGNKPRLLSSGTRPPVIAMWRDGGGWEYHPPQLQFAVWDDGRFIIASNLLGANPRASTPDAWSPRLKEGQISAEQLIDLKQRVGATGTFSLKHPSLVIPDSTYENLMINFGENKQLLQFTFLEIARQPNIVDIDPDVGNLVRCWTAINRVVIADRPKIAKPVTGAFESVPDSWRVKIYR